MISGVLEQLLEYSQLSVCSDCSHSDTVTGGRHRHWQNEVTRDSSEKLGFKNVKCSLSILYFSDAVINISLILRTCLSTFVSMSMLKGQ